MYSDCVSSEDNLRKGQRKFMNAIFPMAYLGVCVGGVLVFALLIGAIIAFSRRAGPFAAKSYLAQYARRNNRED